VIAWRKTIASYYAASIPRRYDGGLVAGFERFTKSCGLPASDQKGHHNIQKTHSHLVILK
jgi:hypothetical protein